MHRSSRQQPDSSASGGFTTVELIVVMAVLAAAMMMFSGTVASTAKQRALDRENVVAADAARSMIERMRAQDHRRVLALFNADPADDPGGPGTAPGNRFVVAGLDPGDALGGMAREVRFPLVDVAAAGAAPDLQLLENRVDPEFGLPRDLNGDSIIDGADRSGDYLLLPVIVAVRWEGKAGAREMSLFATLCEFNWR